MLPNRAGVEETLFVPIGSPPNLTFITGYCRSAYRQIGTEKRPQNLIFLLFLEMYLQIEPPQTCVRRHFGEELQEPSELCDPRLNTRCCSPETVGLLPQSSYGLPGHDASIIPTQSKLGLPALCMCRQRD